MSEQPIIHLVDEPTDSELAAIVVRLEQCLGDGFDARSEEGLAELLALSSKVVVACQAMFARGKQRIEIVDHLVAMGGRADTMTPFVERAEVFHRDGVKPVGGALNGTSPLREVAILFILAVAAAVVGFVLF
jgi:hypothetical protein